jgi:hypothetical protein
MKTGDEIDTLYERPRFRSKPIQLSQRNPGLNLSGALCKNPHHAPLIPSVVISAKALQPGRLLHRYGFRCHRVADRHLAADFQGTRDFGVRRARQLPFFIALLDDDFRIGQFQDGARHLVGPLRRRPCGKGQSEGRQQAEKKFGIHEENVFPFTTNCPHDESKVVAFQQGNQSY